MPLMAEAAFQLAAPLLVMVPASRSMDTMTLFTPPVMTAPEVPSVVAPSSCIPTSK